MLRELLLHSRLMDETLVIANSYLMRAHEISVKYVMRRFQQFGSNNLAVTIKFDVT